MEPRPRFSPDNSPEARRQRMRQFSLAKVVELPHLYILPEPEGYNDNVVYLPVQKPDPPNICA